MVRVVARCCALLRVVAVPGSMQRSCTYLIMYLFFYDVIGVFDFDFL